MPLDLKFDIDINGLRETARWMRQASQQAHDVGTDAIGAKGDSEQGWGGTSGQGFRGFIGKVGDGADKYRDGATTIAGGTDRHADAMNHVKSRLAQAREVASGRVCASRIRRSSSPVQRRRPWGSSRTTRHRNRHRATPRRHRRSPRMLRR